MPKRSESNTLGRREYQNFQLNYCRSKDLGGMEWLTRGASSAGPSTCCAVRTYQFWTFLFNVLHFIVVVIQFSNISSLYFSEKFHIPFPLVFISYSIVEILFHIYAHYWGWVRYDMLYRTPSVLLNTEYVTFDNRHVILCSCVLRVNKERKIRVVKK